MPSCQANPIASLIPEKIIQDMQTKSSDFTLAFWICIIGPGQWCRKYERTDQQDCVFGSPIFYMHVNVVWYSKSRAQKYSVLNPGILLTLNLKNCLFNLPQVFKTQSKHLHFPSCITPIMLHLLYNLIF